VWKGSAAIPIDGIFLRILSFGMCLTTIVLEVGLQKNVSIYKKIHKIGNLHIWDKMVFKN
jgi:hypothetical protein